MSGLAAGDDTDRTGTDPGTPGERLRGTAVHPADDSPAASPDFKKGK